MKEFSLPSDMFTQGLRKYSKRQLNVPGFVECKGFKLDPEGLVPTTALVNPISDPLGVYDWPFPGLVDTSTGLYLLTRTAIYSVNNDWSLTEEISGLQDGGVWDVLDFGLFMVFSNGLDIVQYNPNTAAFEIVVGQIPTCKAMCNFRGQVVVGNTEKGTNFVEWSDIGSLSFSLNRRNEAGNRHMEWSGEVLRIVPLDKHFIVYGDSGISAMGMVKEPIVTFSYETVARYGILGRGAVGFSDTQHVFLDSSRQLRRLSKSGMELLGYQEFFDSMQPEDVNVVYNSVDDEFYISDGNRSFVLTAGGLTETLESISGGVEVDGEFVGVSSELISDYRTLVSNEQDFTYRSQKTIQCASLAVGSGSGIEVAYDWRNASNLLFTRSPYFQVNQEGLVYGAVAGVEFRVVMRWATENSPELPGQLSLAYKLTDKRGVRGTHVSSESNAGSGY